MNSFILCKITGAVIVFAQVGCLGYSIVNGIPPIDFAHAFSGWGIIAALPFLCVKQTT